MPVTPRAPKKSCILRLWWTGPSQKSQASARRSSRSRSRTVRRCGEPASSSPSRKILTLTAGGGPPPAGRAGEGREGEGGGRGGARPLRLVHGRAGVGGVVRERAAGAGSPPLAVN